MATSGLFVRAGSKRGPFYYIRSRAKHGHVLDIRGNNQKPGADVIAYPKKPGAADNQLWYLEDAGDGYLYICSKLNGLVLDIEGGQGAGSKIITWHRKSPPELIANQKWKYEGEFLVSALHGQVLDIKGGSDAKATQIISWKKKSSRDNMNQRWVFEPVTLSGSHGDVKESEAQEQSITTHETMQHTETYHWESRSHYRVND